MTTFTAKHYEAIANLIGWNMMDDDVIDAFSEMFENDSPKFKPARFLRAVQRAAAGKDIWDDIERTKKKLEKISDELSDEERRLLNCDEPHYAAMRKQWYDIIDKAIEILGELLDDK
jgi:hypothetical protein